MGDTIIPSNYDLLNYLDVVVMGHCEGILFYGLGGYNMRLTIPIDPIPEQKINPARLRSIDIKDNEILLDPNVVYVEIIAGGITHRATIHNVVSILLSSVQDLSKEQISEISVQIQHFIENVHEFEADLHDINPHDDNNKFHSFRQTWDNIFLEKQIIATGRKVFRGFIDLATRHWDTPLYMINRYL